MVFLLVSCSQTGGKNGLAPFSPEAVPVPPNYSSPASWLAMPDDQSEYGVDVFWVYPTVLTDDSGWLMDIADPVTTSAARRTLTRQAGVFSGLANIYAPLYRQMNMAGIGLPDDEQDRIMEYGKDDVRKALLYYFEHFNLGKPFILAGHSQGSNILIKLARESWGKNGWEDRMVAAYLIGWSITEDDLKENPSMKICRSDDQTNCFITYNSVAAGRQSEAPTILPGEVAVNPLSWTTGTEPAGAELNLGAIFFFDDGTSRSYPHFTPARIEEGGLVVDPADPSLVSPENAAFPAGVYHAFDYSLFFENLKANIKKRIEKLGSESGSNL